MVGEWLIVKALSIHPSHVEAFILRATAFSQYKHIDISLNVWKKAYRYEKSNRVYQGLVETLVALDKPTEALVFAKEALQSYPKNLTAAALLGFVLSKLPDQKDRAKLVLKSILSNRPDNPEANKYLADIYQEEKNYPEAILLLEGQVKSQPTAELYTRLANVYFWNHDMAKANMYYNAALGLNVNYEPAQQGIKQIEETMVGEGMRTDMSSDDLEEMIADEYTFG
jgi:tetratricopeptide (TPR) repeat protein